MLFGLFSHVSREELKTSEGNSAVAYEFRIASSVKNYKRKNRVVGPGSMNDSRSFQKSGLQGIVENLPDRYYLVGDAAYPLSEHLLIPFVRPQHLDTSKDAFNFYLSQLRIRVEMSFGRLVKKWGILQSTLCCSMKMNSKILVTCGKLHNFCIDCCANEPDLLPTSTNCMPLSRFDYLPTRIEDRDDSDSFIAPSVLRACYARDVIVDYINHQNFVRPTYNVIRTPGSVNNSDGNVMYYTVV